MHETLDLAPAPAKSLAVTEAQQSRQIAEIQGAMVIAKRFPRDENDAYNRIMTACKRPTLAASAKYIYPRGGQTVEGPSIRLAEVLARCWGNLDFGITELEQRNGESTMMAYCWDLETNTRATKVFTVRHERTKNDRKTGQRISTQLDDPRDIYEMNANNGARRMRSCILAVIPGDIVEEAQNQCERTLAGQSKEPLKDRVRKMIALFADQGVTQGMIKGRLGGKVLDAITEAEIVQLGKVYQSLKDGMSKPSDWFAAPDQEDAPAKPAPKKAPAAKAKPDPKPDPDPEPAAKPEGKQDSRHVTLMKMVDRYRDQLGWKVADVERLAVQEGIAEDGFALTLYKEEQLEGLLELMEEQQPGKAS